MFSCPKCGSKDLRVEIKTMAVGQLGRGEEMVRRVRHRWPAPGTQAKPTQLKVQPAASMPGGRCRGSPRP
jgi:hypothetical protein